jgi:signal transduction histidine kinase
MFLKLTRIFRNRLTRNVFLYYFGSQILITAILLSFIFTFMSKILASDLKGVIHARMQKIESLMLRDGLAAVQVTDSDTFVQILDGNNRVLYRSFPKEIGNYDFSPLEKSQANHGAGEWIKIRKEDDEDELLMFSELTGSGVRLQVGKSTEEMNDTIEKMVGLFVSIIVPFLILSFLLGVYGASKVTVQLESVIHTLERIKSGHFNERARVDQTDLNEVVVLFNKMMDQIELLIKKNRHELDHFAHDIKTPITRFKLISERALMNRDDAKLTLWALEEAADSADEITAMISSLFDISLTESGAKTLSKSQVLVSEIIGEVVDVYQYVANEKEISIDVKVQSESTIFADRLQLKRIFSNLIDNAVKYGKSNSLIQVTINRVQDQVQVSVQDSGIGIQAEDLTQVWDRFFRGENAKDHAAGYGLGLSFVKAMTEIHGGKVLVESTPNQGATFILKFNHGVR